MVKSTNRAVRICVVACVALAGAGTSCMAGKVTLEDVVHVHNLCDSSSDAREMFSKWMNSDLSPKEFESDAVMLLLRLLPDHLSDRTQREALATRVKALEIPDDTAIPMQPRYMPFRTLKDVAVIRLESDSTDKAVAALHELYDKTKKQDLFPVGYLQNEMTYLMLAAGKAVPEAFQRSPEFVRHDVYRKEKDSDPSQIFTNAMCVITTTNFPADPIRWQRHYFEWISYQCLLLRHSKALQGEARRFLETYDRKSVDTVTPIEKRTALYAYIVVARHAPNHEDSELRTKLDKTLRGGVQLNLGALSAMFTATDEVWWYRHTAFPAGSPYERRAVYERVYRTGVELPRSDEDR